jgi:ABC-type dipeptide/oligopeptide/nickel transport system permease subunit
MMPLIRSNRKVVRVAQRIVANIINHRNWWPLLLIFFLLLVAPFLANHNPRHANSGDELLTPSTTYWLGTDHLGRDLWSRLVVGGQRTLAGAIAATLIALGGGLLLASLTAFGPTWSRYSAGVILDAILAFPGLLVALVIRTLLSGSLWSLALAVGLAGIASLARVASDALHSAQTAAHIEGALAIGVSPFRLVTRHVIPTALPALTSFGSVLFGWLLLNQAALAFLGLGGDPSTPSWGLIMSQGRGYVEQAPQLVIAPGILLAVCVWSANRLADRLA